MEELEKERLKEGGELGGEDEVGGSGPCIGDALRLFRTEGDVGVHSEAEAESAALGAG